MLRNPWRMCFDPDSGLMLVGDVGQNLWEEVDVIRPGGNYGWRAREGMHPNPNLRHPEDPISADTDPIAEYEHRIYDDAAVGRPILDNCIVGGLVYRGNSAPSLSGWYVYADYNSGRIWGLKHRRGRLLTSALLLESKTNPSSFGEDASGELYLCDHQQGRVLRIINE